MAAELHRPLQFSLAIAKVHRLHNYYNHPLTPVSLPPPSGLPPLSHLSPSSLRPPSSLHRCRLQSPPPPLHRPTGRPEASNLATPASPLMDSAGRSGSIQATTTTREGGGERIRRWWDSGGWICRLGPRKRRGQGAEGSGSATGQPRPPLGTQIHPHSLANLHVPSPCALWCDVNFFVLDVWCGLCRICAMWYGFVGFLCSVIMTKPFFVDFALVYVDLGFENVDLEMRGRRMQAFSFLFFKTYLCWRRESSCMWVFSMFCPKIYYCWWST